MDKDDNQWYIIKADLAHNHTMIQQQQIKFTPQERNLPDDVKERILLFRRAGCDVPQILSILEEEFSGQITWIYNDIYNYIYQSQGLASQRKLDAHEFIRTLELMKEKNSEFKFHYRTNSQTNQLESVIWMFPEQYVISITYFSQI